MTQSHNYEETSYVNENEWQNVITWSSHKSLKVNPNKSNSYTKGSILFQLMMIFLNATYVNVHWQFES